MVSRPTRLSLRVASLGLSLLITTSAFAVQMYRWVDEHGVTNVSDAVPDKYKHVATKVDSSQYNLTAQQRRAAASQAALLVGRAAAVAPLESAASSAALRRTRKAARAPAAVASGDGDGDDCATLQRRYREAQKCFAAGPKTINGTVNAARSPQCPIVVDPAPKCGLPTLRAP